MGLMIAMTIAPTGERQLFRHNSIIPFTVLLSDGTWGAIFAPVVRSSFALVVEAGYDTGTMATLAAAMKTTTLRQRRWVGGFPDSAQCGADKGVTHRCLGCRVPGRPEDPYFLSQKERYQH